MTLIHKAVNKIRSKIHNGITDIYKKTGFTHNILKEARGSKIIVYHGIDNSSNQKYNTRFISQKRLDEHLTLFKTYFDIVSVEDIFENQIDPNRFSIAITFDDGYVNNLTHAIPVIKKHQVPTLFCITGISETDIPILWADLLDINARENKKPLTIQHQLYSSSKKHPCSRYEYKDENNGSLKSMILSSDNSFRSEAVNELSKITDWNLFEKHAVYWKQMNQEQIKQMASLPYVSIASHGYYHNDLTAISLEDAIWELTESKLYLEDITQKKINTIAYPYGSSNLTVIREARKLGYNMQLLADTTFEKKLNENIRVKNRFAINPYISAMNQAIAIVTGKYH